MKELTTLKTSNNKKLLVVLPLNQVEEVMLSECAYSLSNQTQPIDVLVLTNGLNDEQIKNAKIIFDKPAIKITTKQESGELKQEVIESKNTINYTFESTEKTSFVEVFNEAFNYAIVNDYELISIVEHDDVVDAKWYDLTIKYSEEKDDVDGFMPLIREISNGVFIGFFNEACWSEGMAEAAGYTDLQLLLKFSCLNLTGGVFKVASIKEYSDYDDNDIYKPFKESVKLSYMYEFFLRMIYNDLKIYTIPRIGYEHRIDRHGEKVDLFTSKIPRDLTERTPENGGMTSEEIQFWIDLAKKEYFFDEDRNIDYDPQKKEAPMVT